MGFSENGNKYELTNDTLNRYFDELIDTSIVLMFTADSLIIENKF